LQRLLASELTAREELDLEGHLRECPRCRHLLEEWTAPTTTGVHKCPAESHPDDFETSPQLLDRLKEWAAPGLELPAEKARTGTEGRPFPRIAGYEVLELLGHGGMGVVYKARQVALNRTVALKMILGGAFASKKSLVRFRAEAEAVARLQHPNIIQIHEIGETEGLSYLCLEYVEGGTIASKLAGAVIPPRRAAELVEVLARSVQFAHERGILHRDLKPANILLTPEGAPKIADFGLAKRLEDSPQPDVSSSEAGMALGTPRYMAPELLQSTSGQRPVPSPAADIYSLGAILYELLTGRPLYEGATTVDVLVRVLHEDPVQPRAYRPEIPRDLEVICLRCLAKEPARRYASARDLADDLQRFLLGARVLACGPSLLYRATKFVKRNTILVVATTAVGLALALGILLAGNAAINEGNQRRIAVQNAQLAEAAKGQALEQTYQARMAAALAALDDHNVPEAADQLAAAPAAERGWEWSYLESRLDDSVAIVRGLGFRSGLCPPGKYVATTTANGVRLLDAASGKSLQLLTPGTPDRLDLLDSQAGNYVICDYAPGNCRLLNTDGKLIWESAMPDKTYTLAGSLNHSRTQLAYACRVLQSPKSPMHFGLYDLATGKLRTSFALPAGVIISLAFSPDDSLLVSGGEDRTVRLWDTATGKCLRTLLGHEGFVHSVAFSPDGKRVLSGSADQTFRQWDVKTGALLDQRYGHVDKVHSVAYSPDGRWIVSASFDATVRLWRAEGGAAVTVLHGHTARILQVGFTDDGSKIGSLADDGTARLWDSRSKEDARVLRGHDSYVYPVAYAPDGTVLATGAWDQKICLWDAMTGERRRVLSGHTDYIKSLKFSLDGRRLFSQAADNFLCIWDCETGSLIARTKGGMVVDPATPYYIALSPDGKEIGCPHDAQLDFFSVDDASALHSLKLPTRQTRLAVYTPGGEVLAVAGAEPEIYLLDGKTGTVTQTLKGHKEVVHGLSFSADGGKLVSAGADGTVRLWDASTGEMLRVFQRHTTEVFAAVFHPDGSRIASAGRDRVIRIWNPQSGAEVARLQGHNNYVFSLAFSPDGQTLLSGSGDYTARLWDTFPISRRLLARERRATRP
jgi:WD40 repeat protein